MCSTQEQPGTRWHGVSLKAASMRSQPADSQFQTTATEGRMVISALPKRRPFLPGDFEARKQFSSSLLHLPSVSHKTKDKGGFPCKGLGNLGAGPRALGREQGFPEWGSSVIAGSA